MSEELCVECDRPTGKAGRDEDSLYLPDGDGPFCDECYFPESRANSITYEGSEPVTPDQKWAYKQHGHMTDEAIRGEIARLKYGLRNLKPEQSGQASNYYAPAIHYLKVELERRGSNGSKVE